MYTKRYTALTHRNDRVISHLLNTRGGASSKRPGYGTSSKTQVKKGRNYCSKYEYIPRSVRAALVSQSYPQTTTSKTIDEPPSETSFDED